jgi:hypothetical protein
MVMWNEMIINNKPLRPLIFVGSEWQAVISQFIDSLGPYIRMDVREIISLVPDIDSAYEKLNTES